MGKRYNIFIISRLYVKRYYKFLIEETNIKKSDDALGLFMYSIKKVYGLDTVEYSKAIDRYGKKCIKYLQETPDTPKNKKNVPFEDKVRLVSVCEGYATMTDILSNKVIRNSRV